MKIVQWTRLVTLRSHMKTIQAIFVDTVLIGAFFKKYLSNLNITIEWCKMNGLELLLNTLLIYPLLHNSLHIIRIYLIYSLFSHFEQTSYYNRLILISSLMKQCEAIIIVNMPDLEALWYLLYLLNECLNLRVLFNKSFSLEWIQTFTFIHRRLLRQRCRRTPLINWNLLRKPLTHISFHPHFRLIKYINLLIFFFIFRPNYLKAFIRNLKQSHLFFLSQHIYDGIKIVIRIEDVSRKLHIRSLISTVLILTRSTLLFRLVKACFIIKSIDLHARARIPQQQLLPVLPKLIWLLMLCHSPTYYIF